MGIPPRFRLTSPRPAPQVEEHVVKACRDALHYRQYWTTKLHAGTFKSLDNKRWIKGVPKGTPDYLAAHEFYPAFFIEFKRPGAKPTPEQEQVHLSIKLGYRIATAVVDSIEALSAWLKAHEAKWPRGP